jgi:hypothetical protein
LFGRGDFTDSHQKADCHSRTLSDDQSFTIMAERTHRFSDHIKLRNAKRLYAPTQVPLPTGIQQRYARYEFAINGENESYVQDIGQNDGDVEDITTTSTNSGQKRSILRIHHLPCGTFDLQVGDMLRKKKKFKVGPVHSDYVIFELNRDRIYFGNKDTRELNNSHSTDTLGMSYERVRDGVVESIPSKKEAIWVKRNPQLSRELYSNQKAGIEHRKEPKIYGDDTYEGWIRCNNLPVPLQSADPMRKVNIGGSFPFDASCPFCSKDLTTKLINYSGTFDFIDKIQRPPYSKYLGPKGWDAITKHLERHCQSNFHPFFHCIYDWDSVNKKSDDWTIGMQVQSLLNKSLDSSQLHLDVFLHVEHTKDESLLRMRLYEMKGFINGVLNEERRVLKKRSWIQKYDNHSVITGELCSLEKKIWKEHKDKIIDEFVGTSLNVVNDIFQSLFDFHFFSFINDLGNSNPGTSGAFVLWNSLCCYFKRGVFFDGHFPPVPKSVLSSPLETGLLAMIRCSKFSFS